MSTAPTEDLRGKVVMVTGASSGLGREFCVDLATAGCHVIAAARRVDRLQSLCSEINSSAGGRAAAVELDVCADGAAIQIAVGKAWDAFGKIDALINNAGMRGQSYSSLPALYYAFFIYLFCNKSSFNLGIQISL